MVVSGAEFLQNSIPLTAMTSLSHRSASLSEMFLNENDYYYYYYTFPARKCNPEIKDFWKISGHFLYTLFIIIDKKNYVKIKELLWEIL